MDFEGRFHLMITLIFNVLTNDLVRRRESLEPDMGMLYASIGDNESSKKHHTTGVMPGSGMVKERMGAGQYFINYIFLQPCPPPAAPTNTRGRRPHTEHPGAVYRSVWLGRARCFSITVGGRSDRR
jgi:hypothetical protein